MANPLKGEVELVAGELGVFTLVLDCNALASLQAALGLATGPQGDQAFLGRIPYLPVSQPHDMRLLLFQALQRHHGRGSESAFERRVNGLVEAGEVMDAAGIPAVRSALANCIVLAYPETATASDTPPPKAGSLGAGAD